MSTKPLGRQATLRARRDLEPVDTSPVEGYEPTAWKLKQRIAGVDANALALLRAAQAIQEGHFDREDFDFIRDESDTPDDFAATVHEMLDEFDEMGPPPESPETPQEGQEAPPQADEGVEQPPPPETPATG